MRAEKASGSELGQLIMSYIDKGACVPGGVTCQLLMNAMESAGFDKKFLIDGFPRTADNKSGWEEHLGDKTELAAVLYFEAKEEVMTERILARSKTSGRADDNVEALKQRYASFREE